MIPGYNHNVKYKDRIYHVQTEDSGLESPHIITHLFFGGNIIVSRKISYGDRLQQANLTEAITQLMQEQHKTVLKGLIKGSFDSDIAIRSANAHTLDGPAPLNVDAGAQQRTSLGLGAGGHGMASSAASKPAAAVAIPSGPSPAQLDSGNNRVLEAAALQAAFESNNDKAVDSLFGNLISEKSLDEVILSYLSDEANETP